MDLSQELVRAVEQALGVDTTKVNSDGFTRKPVRCPMKNHDNDTKSPAAHWNTSKHFLHCFKCDEDYKLHVVAESLGLDPKQYYEKSVEVVDTRRPYEGLADYARAHGLTAEELSAWHWRECERQGRPALEFPTTSGPRWRFLDGKKPYYKHIEGYNRCWYGLKIFVENQLRIGKPLVLCNGEISTVTAQYNGVAAICMTAGEKGEIPTTLLNQLKGAIPENTTIIIAMDCDAAGRRSARGLREQLKNEGFSVRAVDMGLGKGGDLADFCMLNQKQSCDALERLPDLADELDTKDRSWRTEGIGTMLKIPQIEWLVPRLIPLRLVTTVFGPSGTYKSFFTLHHALMVAQNNHVIYVASEGDSGYRQRLEAWFKHHKGMYTENMTFVLGEIDITSDDDLYTFEQLIEQRKPSLIVVDTMSRSIGEKDTNKSTDVVKVYNTCSAIASKHNCAIVIVHHTNAEGRRATGSERIRDSTDMMIRLTRVDDVIEVDCKKAKDSSAFKPFHLKEIQIPLGYKNNLGEDVTSLVLEPAERVIRDDVTDLQASVLREIQLEPSLSYSELADVLETSRNSIASVIRKLMRKSHIARTGKGLELTTSGERVLDELETDSDSSDSPLPENVKVSDFPAHAESVESGNQQSFLPRRQENHYEREI